ncbi:MAG: DUF4838 domain-containing protein, partial [Gemmatimonadota bacterium]
MRSHALLLIATGAGLLLAAGAARASTFSPQWANALKPAGTPAPALTLASRGKAACALLLPAQPTTQDEKAAADLAQWLGQIAGADFAILREGAGPAPSAKVISIGRTALLERAALPEAGLDLGDEGYAIAVRDGNLYLLGGRTRGPINAVYALLEEDLGCRWYHRDSVTLPSRPELTVRPVPRHFVPVLEIRDPFYWDAFDGTWSLRNRTNAPSAPVAEEWGGHVDYALFVHTYNTLVPPDLYFEDHPEYFSELAGKRQPVQLCLTNPEVLPIAVAKVREVLRSHPDSEIISVSPNDGTGYCECAACKAIDDAEGTRAGTLIRFVNAVADSIRTEFPRVRVSTLAYLDTYQPPKTVRPRDNVAIQLCTDRHAWSRPFLTVTETEDFQQAMKAWEAIGATMHIWDYTTNFSHYLAPMPNLPVVTPDIRFYVEHGARGVMLQGAYQSPGSADAPLRCWVWAKQLWDPSLDTRALMRDFVYGYYGEAAEPMWQYEELLWGLWERYHRQPGTTPDENPLLADIRYTPDNPVLAGDFPDTALALFAKAEAAATDPETLRRVQRARLSVLYVALCQGVGFQEDGGQLRLGQRFRGAAAGGRPDDVYRAWLDELTRTVAREKVTHFAEGAPDAERKIQTWQELMSTALPEVDFREVGNRWRFRPDPDDAGVRERWYGPEVDDGGWAEVRSDQGNGWESQGFPGYLGHAWYRQRVSMPADLQGARLCLLFGAVDEDAEVYINGRKAFTHTSASTGLTPAQIWVTPFAFDPRPFLQPGQNLMAVRVHNSLGMGGVWKPAYFVALDQEADPRLVLAVIQARQ